MNTTNLLKLLHSSDAYSLNWAQILTGFAIDFDPNEIMDTDGLNVTFVLPHYGIVLQCHGFVIGQYSPTLLYC